MWRPTGGGLLKCPEAPDFILILMGSFWSVAEEINRRAHSPVHSVGRVTSLPRVHFRVTDMEREEARSAWERKMSLALFHQTAVDVSSSLFYLPHRSSCEGFRVLLLKGNNSFHFILTGYYVFSFNCIWLQCRRPCSECYLRAYLVFLGVLQGPRFTDVCKVTELGIVMRATHSHVSCLTLTLAVHHPLAQDQSIHLSVSLSLSLPLSLPSPPLSDVWMDNM